jgi:NAD dependent epimerase/dehydratase family enzyme
LPAFLLRFLVGEMGQLVLESHWVSAQKIKEKGFAFQYSEILSACKHLVSNY